MINADYGNRGTSVASNPYSGMGLAILVVIFLIVSEIARLTVAEFNNVSGPN